MTEINMTKKEEKELLFKALFGSPFFNILASVLATFVVGAIFFKYGGGVPIQVTQTSTEKVSTFDVAGEGRVVVVPDEAVLQLGVSEQGHNLKVVQQALNTKLEQLGQNLKAMGIAEKDIKTTNYNFYPDYQEVGLYRAQANLSVKIRELDKVSLTLDQVGLIGLDVVSGPSFGLSEELSEKATREAREMAIAKAKNKAGELAELAGMKLGRIVNITEGGNGGYPVPMYSRDAVASTLETKVETPVEVGSSEVVVKVTLSYETR